MTRLRRGAGLRASLGRLTADKVNLVLLGVYLLAAVFYIWTAATSLPFALNSSGDAYNRLATAFLHFHVTVIPTPSGLLHLSEPYSVAQNEGIQAAYLIHDYIYYKGHLYLSWGPTPVLVLLIPLHLLGFAPTTGLTATFFALAGLAFALAALRILLRQVSPVKLWMCGLAGCAMALSSVVPYILRRPAVYEVAVAGGYCFAMAGIWLALSALVDRRTSPRRLAVMSLCFGLAVGSRPTLGLVALVLIPVYLAARNTNPRRGTMLAVAGPIGACFLLLLAYNQARFGTPTQFGLKYVLGSWNPRTTHYGNPSFLLPAAWNYLLAPPRPLVSFPFLEFTPPPNTYPFRTAYTGAQMIGGLLPMAPVTVCLVGLPAVWRRRPDLLGPLSPTLLIFAFAGFLSLLFVSYELPGTAQRYSVDFSTLFLLGGLAVWLALSNQPGVWSRRLIRSGGALLVAWGCLTGLALSFKGEENLLATSHPDIWSTLERLSAPLSRAIIGVAGHPVLTQVSAPFTIHESAPSFWGLGSVSPTFAFGRDETAVITIMSPGSRRAELTAKLVPELLDHSGKLQSSRDGLILVLVRGPGSSSYLYKVPLDRRGPAHIQVGLSGGLNHIELVPASDPAQAPKAPPGTSRVLEVGNLAVR